LFVPTLFFTPTILSKTHNMHAYMEKKFTLDKGNNKKEEE
jgi:hypothetical protein